MGKPEMDGLFCERIFGPSKSLECACGKYKRVRYDGLICERCGVELTESRVRRHRMGHINLIYPVTHVWYTNSRPNYMALLLEVEQCEKRLDTGLLSDYPDILTLMEQSAQSLKDSKPKQILYDILRYSDLILEQANSEISENHISLKDKRKALKNRIIYKDAVEQNYKLIRNTKNLGETKKALKKCLNLLRKDQSLMLIISKIYREMY